MKHLDGNFEGLGAELIAIKVALELAVQMRCHKIIVESDSELAIKFINKSLDVWSEVECTVVAIWDLIPFFSEVVFNFIPRNVNRVADKLAKWAKMSKSDGIWVEDFSAWIVSMVEDDRFLCGHVAS